MAKPKCVILVTVVEVPTEAEEGLVSVWANDVDKRESDIYRIEGITSIGSRQANLLMALTDPRYDIEEIVKEIKALLAEKPES